MNNLRKESLERTLKTVVFPLMLTLIVVITMVIGAFLFSGSVVTQDLELTESSIRKTVITCYADEGRYPPDISYMEERYGLRIDHDRYNVVYDCMASNIFPNIDVYVK